MSHKTPPPNHLISHEILAFIIDRKSRNLSPRTIQFYENELSWFVAWLSSDIGTIEQLTPDLIRQYLIHLQTTRNAGGIHAAFRVLKAFLNWYALEIDDPAYKNPIKKITPPAVSKEPLPGITPDHIRRMLSAIPTKTFLDARDHALILFLFDTGLRREECIALDLANLDLKSGAIQVLHGKGDKKRTVYCGAKCRKEIIRYLRFRTPYSPSEPLWLNNDGQRLGAAGLRQILRRRAADVGLPEPGAHDFRRAFALESLRNGMNIVTLMHLMGHTTTTVLLRYLKLVENDLQTGHASASPADNL